MRAPDFLIVGGGSAGAVLAARLSENSAHEVLLVEAGDDTPPGAVPADIDDTFPNASLNPAYFWPGLEASVTQGGAVRPFPQARIMGGGSSIMGMFTLRGVPSDYDRWGEAGAGSFSWDEVQPYFEKVEREYPIRHTAREDWPALVHATQHAAARNGHASVADMNAAPADGFFSMAASRDDNVRSTSARSYLTPAVRARANLRILTNTRVARLCTEGRRVTGVEAERGGETMTLNAGRVVVCAGAIHSPALLLRSGIGPAAELAALGITPVADRPGVGRNLQNHCYLFYALTLPRGQRMAQALRRFALAGLRVSSKLPGCPGGDLMLFLLGRVSGRAFGTDVAMMAACLYSPFSTGRVTLASADPHAAPRIDFNMLADSRDAPRVVLAARLAERLLQDPEVAACYGEAMLLPAGMSANQFNRAGLAGDLFAAAARIALNAPAPLRRLAMRLGFPGGKLLRAERGASTTDEDLLAAITPMGHPAGTCAMGRADDPNAVVDARYRVHGVDGLCVVDASVMPVLPSANTNLPTLMLAEHAAARIAWIDIPGDNNNAQPQ